MPDSLDIENLSLWIVFMFVQRLVSSPNGSHPRTFLVRFYAGCSPRFQDMFGEGFPIFADSLDASRCSEAVYPKDTYP